MRVVKEIIVSGAACRAVGWGGGDQADAAYVLGITSICPVQSDISAVPCVGGGHSVDCFAVPQTVGAVGVRCAGFAVGVAGLLVEEVVGVGGLTCLRSGSGGVEWNLGLLGRSAFWRFGCHWGRCNSR